MAEPTGVLPSLDAPSGDSLRWIGAGETALLVPAERGRGKGPPSVPGNEAGALLRVSGLEELEGRELGEGERERARDFLELSRQGAWLLSVPAAPRQWLGEDGGPGERTGLHLLRDAEPVSSLVLPEPPPAVLELILDFARRAPDLFLFIERDRDASASGGGELRNVPRFSRDLPNVALVERADGWNAARLAGWLAADDPAPWRGTGGRSGAASSAPRLAREALEVLSPLREWRRWTGLRRSLDAGTRWLLFEPLHELVLRRVERQVRAFIHELSLGAILPPWGGEGLAVECRPGEERGCVSLVVDTRLEPLWLRSFRKD